MRALADLLVQVCARELIRESRESNNGDNEDGNVEENEIQSQTRD
jgi:hypothetical protein